MSEKIPPNQAMAATINEYAERSGVRCRTVPSLDGLVCAIFVPGPGGEGVLSYESGSLEALGCHIDMLRMHKDLK